MLIRDSFARHCYSAHKADPMFPVARHFTSPSHSYCDLCMWFVQRTNTSCARAPKTLCGSVFCNLPPPTHTHLNNILLFYSSLYQYSAVQPHCTCEHKSVASLHTAHNLLSVLFLYLSKCSYNAFILSTDINVSYK